MLPEAGRPREKLRTDASLSSGGIPCCAVPPKDYIAFHGVSKNPPFLALRFVNLLAVTIALEISYMDSPKNSSHESKSHVFRVDE
jgi:hypothetical protein